jgi:two-component system phosphate regulon sensor histidine kinase PhoR
MNAGYDDKEAFDHFMPMISAQASRMKQLINDLLNLASVEKQLTVPPSDLIDIKELMAFVTKQLEWELSQNNITLKVDLSDNLKPIIGDRNQLVQVFYNLITNAIKYGKANTDIIIEASETEVPEHAASGIEEFHRMLMISFQDFGEGIEQEDIERLTERFFRVDKSRSKKIGGTGLGLSIVKQILIRHNGFLDIKSKAKEGSTFTVYLPIYEHFNEMTHD